MHLVRQRRHRALWMKGLLASEKASMSILLDLLLIQLVLHFHLSLLFLFSLTLCFPFCRFHRDQLSK